MAEQVSQLQQRLAALEHQSDESQPNKIADHHPTLPHVVVDNDRPEKDRAIAGRKSDC
jgi:hypothetical protein